MKMKKLVALITASALCLGMSMTVFATPNNPSPDDESLAINGMWINGTDSTNPGVGYNKEGASVKADPLSTSLVDIQANYIKEYKDKYPDTPLTDAQILAIDAVKEKVDAAYKEVCDTLWNSPEGRKNMKEAFAENGYNVKDGETPVLIAAGNLVPVDKYGNPITDFAGETLYQEFYIGDEEGVTVGSTIYVLHYNIENNSWEVIEAVVQGGHDRDKYVNVEFKNGLSPVGFIKVMQNGVAVKVDKNGVPVTDDKGNVQVVNKGTNTTTKAPTKASSAVTGKSPKTGEF